MLSEHLANRFKNAMLPPVLATPTMILVMENAALNALKPYIETGESAVGTTVDVRHLAAIPVGRDVHATAEAVKVERRRIDNIPDQAAARIRGNEQGFRPRHPPRRRDRILAERVKRLEAAAKT